MNILKKILIISSIIFFQQALGIELKAQSQCPMNKKKLSSNTISDDHKSVREQIIELYPHLDKEFLNKKIDLIQNPFYFFRSFVADYYVNFAKKYLLNRDDLFLLNNFVALATGDPHVENFGTIIGIKGDGAFTMNDPDDSGLIPIYLDYVRLLASLYLYTNDLNEEVFSSMFYSYVKGLKNSPRKYSQKIRKILKKSSKMGRSAALDEFKNNELIRSIIDGEVESLADNEDQSFKDAIEIIFESKIKIYDSLKYINKSGGSGGLYRYRFLVEINQKTPNDFQMDKLQIIEFKAIGPSGAEFITNTILNPLYRIDLTLRLEHFENNPFFGSISVNNQNFYFRPRWEGNKKINLTKFKNKDLIDIVSDEFYMLGKIHRQSLNGNIESYIVAIEEFGVEKISSIARFCSELTKKRFWQSKNI
ncbi:MAG: DUF2252 family protein [Halobacteriovoraceae bacterium]|nr:DUF2252 family protein [Halobacteriovoraceae bacterium]